MGAFFHTEHECSEKFGAAICLDVAESLLVHGILVEGDMNQTHRKYSHASSHSVDRKKSACLDKSIASLPQTSAPPDIEARVIPVTQMTAHEDYID